MKAYFFTIFARAFLAFSGLLVFLLTAQLYGPEGRGVIGYATSLFATFGSLLSFNLGRGFISATIKQEDKKNNLIGEFLVLNFIFGIIASAGGLIYLFFTTTAKEMLTPFQASMFALTSVFYIWSANGNYFFSSFSKTSLQDRVILAVRIILILALGILIFIRDHDLDHFITIYCFTLIIGVGIENYILIKMTQAKLFKK